MNALLHYLAKPWHLGVRWYLSKARPYSYKDINLTVSPGVFHPGFFFSTRMVREFLEGQDIQQKKLLELGSGSGFLSIVAAKHGAIVTACDISGSAVRNTILNAQTNLVDIRVIESDLFQLIPQQVFEWIIVNPPYYPADPDREEQHAWYCGAQHQYFEKFFKSLKNYTDSQSQIVMVLSDVCDLKKIVAIAEKHQWALTKILEKRVWADGKNYLFRIKRSESLS